MKIKIISNPYKNEINYEIQDDNGQWLDVNTQNPNGKLREESVRKCFLPFNVKEILSDIVNDYYLAQKGAIDIIFEGTKEEYIELERLCNEEEFVNKINLSRSNVILDSGKFILSDTKEIFERVKPVIEEVITDETDISNNLQKVTDALDDIVPICVFGNYSAGKSTFINALIGREILPSGGDPVTAKAFKIQNSSQRDIAKITFEHWDDKIEIIFEEDDYRIIKGNKKDPMLVELNSILGQIEEPTMNKLVAYSLDFINAYEKRDMDSLEIGNMIEVVIAFSKKGILGKSSNKFVIFDTPGSNTASNDGHIEVLKDALTGFSNGIPVWVATYEAVDTMDNEKLCNDILSIDALDTRFTMIVFNKADNSELPEGAFNENQIRNIREFNSVEKMYAGGIFFVSSIMGLGAKSGGKFDDKHYRKIFKYQNISFSDPEDEDYMTLYNYNIMPEQIKSEIIDSSHEEDNLIYVNSGLFCVEKEMEDFASKYSAYNKCQMVYSLLSVVIEKTNHKIDKRIESRKKLREKYKNDLENKKQELIETMHNTTQDLEKKFNDESYNSINNYAKKQLDYNYPIEELDLLNQKYTVENNTGHQVEDKKKSYENAKEGMVSKLKDSLKNSSVSDFKNSVITIADVAREGVKHIQNTRKDLEENKKRASSDTVDAVMKEVIEKYKKSMADAVEQINHIARNYWENNSQFLKDKLVEIVTVSDALTDKQKETLSQLIFDYQNITFDDKASTVFVKPKFLLGHLMGLDLFRFEKINTKKLAKEYNKTVAENIEDIATEMNKDYFESYKKWQENLSDTIEKNIVDLNPELQVIWESIDSEAKKINRLETSQQEIRKALNEIENLISFRNAE